MGNLLARNAVVNPSSKQQGTFQQHSTAKENGWILVCAWFS